MSMLSFGVYYVRNNITGHVYVGSTCRTFLSRRIDHWTKLRLGVHKNSRLTRAWRKYGADAFEFVIAEIAADPEGVLKMEQEHLDRHFGKACYNVRPTAESNRGWIASKETRKRMGEANKRRAPFTAERREKISKGCMGKVRNRWSPESREKMSRAKMGKPKPDGFGAIVSERNRQRLTDPVFRAKNAAMLKANRGKANLARQKNFTGVFISPSGEEYSGVVNLTKFCAQHGLGISGMSQVANGKDARYKGWTYRV